MKVRTRERRFLFTAVRAAILRVAFLAEGVLAILPLCLFGCAPWAARPLGTKTNGQPPGPPLVTRLIVQRARAVNAAGAAFRAAPAFSGCGSSAVVSGRRRPCPPSGPPGRRSSGTGAARSAALRQGWSHRRG